MKLLALLALIPAISTQVLARPSPEPYHPFPSTFEPNSTIAANPISHGSLNDRAQIVAKAPIYHAPGRSGGKVKRQGDRMVKKSLRRVKRQNATCVPATGTGRATSTGAGTTTSKTGTATTKAGTTMTQQTKTTQATTSPKTTTAKTTAKTTTAAKPQTTNFTVDPDGNGPFKGMATCRFPSSPRPIPLLMWMSS